MEHIVLEYDESTRTALVVATSNKREPVLSGHASPYIVADGYDFESRSWGAGHYFTDIAAAKIDYERSCRHSYPLAEGRLRDDEFCTIRWCREDVATALSEYLSYPIPATKKNIDDVVGQLMAHGSFQDRSIEDGWETISAIIDEDALDLGLSTKQGVDFYRDAFGHWNSTEAIVWPSSEGDAAFVMAVPADSEDGDLAVYKIDACLIARRPRLRRTPLRLYPGTERFGRGAKARHLALPAADRAALPAHLAPDRPARDGIGGGERRIRRRGGPAGTSRV